MFCLFFLFLTINQLTANTIGADMSPIHKRDEVLAMLFNYGDPKHTYPSVVKISKVCDMKWKDGLTEMMTELSDVLKQFYSDNEVVIKLCEVMFSQPLIPVDECRLATGPQSRSASRQTKVLNESRFKAKDYRRLLNRVLAEASTPGTQRLTLPKLVCYLNLWKIKTIPKYPLKDNVRKRVEKHINGFLNPIIEYLMSLTSELSDQSMECDFSDVSDLEVEPTFQSIQLNLIQSVDNLSKK